MPRKLKRDKLWKAVQESGIFKEPSLYFRGTWWCVSFVSPKSAYGREMITLDKTIEKSLKWVEWAKGKGIRYP